MTQTRAVHILLITATVFMQAALALLLGFGGAMGLGIGDGWELLAMPVANAAGIVIAAVPLALLERTRRPGLTHFLAALVGALIGALLIWKLPPMGYRGMLLPIALGIIAFYLESNRASRSTGSTLPLTGEIT